MTKTLKTSLTAAFVAVVLAAGGSALVMAQDGQMPRRGPGGPGGPGIGMRGPGGPMGPMGFAPGFRQLDLTDDQKTQIKAITDSHQAEFKAAGEKVGAAREALRKLLQADAIDETAIRAKSVEVANAEADASILGAKVRAQSLQVLTSEQLAKLKELQAARQSQPRKQRGQGRR